MKKLFAKTGVYSVYKKPFVRFTNDYLSDSKSKLHPHIVVAKIGKKYVSVGVTHSPIVRGKTTDELPDNIERSYVVNSGIYVRDKKEYTFPHQIDGYHVTNRDKNVAEDIIKNATKVYK